MMPIQCTKVSFAADGEEVENYETSYLFAVGVVDEVISNFVKNDAAVHIIDIGN